MNKDTQLGYCCINLNLRQIPVTVNRTCRKATFESGGLPHVSNLALQNIRDLVEIIKWNEKNGFKVYRMSSNMFPWMSEYELKDLPDYQKISTLLKGAGNLAKKYGQRLSFHPGPFNVLGSPNPTLVTKTIKELNQSSEIMDIMGLEQSNHYPINIHCNGVYGDKKATLQRWSDNYRRLSKSAQSRLVVENDDKGSMYSVKDLYWGIFTEVRVPITFDFHHHRFNDSGLSEEEAFVMAKETWEYHNVKPLFHYSSCRRTFEDPTCKVQAHADFIYEKINDYGYAVDIEVEAKAKEVAVLKYKDDGNKLLESYLPFEVHVDNQLVLEV
jgi:UV DNA damage endonuclease|tara:strand:- start:1424 stop:2404 length:981 start_codon:yes stop_codon:yes gene_type:complete